MAEDHETMVEKKHELMVSPSVGKPIFRIAHFLKPKPKRPPFASTSTHPQPQMILASPPSIPPTNPIAPVFDRVKSCVKFYGWRSYPPRGWNDWVTKLRPLYEPVWREASIYEAIISTTCEIPKSRSSIFGLAERWCSETNTFVLPWGEVTITMEDVMALGSFPATGDSVLTHLKSRELVIIVDHLQKVRKKLVRTPSHKASQQQWLNAWMDKGSPFEHEAFLTLWLSRYVLPADDCGVINKRVLLIAVLLARGRKFAFAPPVLASLYRDLSLLKERIDYIRGLADDDNVVLKRLNLWSPLHLLQVWIWERFSKISPEPNSMIFGVTRLERWHKVKRPSDNEDVGVFFDSGRDDFRWRPYSAPLNNWSFEVDLESYGRCIRVGTLVGLKCVEYYYPHRVAMQFGLDQDIPIAFPELNVYNNPIGDDTLYMPPRVFEADVTVRYSEWWKQGKVVQGNGSSKKSVDVLESRMRNRLACDDDAPPSFSPFGKRVAMEAGEPSLPKGSGMKEQSDAGVGFPPGFGPAIGKRMATEGDGSSGGHERSLPENSRIKKERESPAVGKRIAVESRVGSHGNGRILPSLRQRRANNADLVPPPFSPMNVAGCTWLDKEKNADVPPGLASKGKRVAMELGSTSGQRRQPSSKSSSLPADAIVIDLEYSDSETTESDSPPVSSSARKRQAVKPAADDHSADRSTLTQTFRANSLETQGRTATFVPVILQPSPFASAGNNAAVQATNRAPIFPAHISPPINNVIRQGHTVNRDGTENNIQRPINRGGNEGHILFGHIQDMSQVIELQNQIENMIGIIRIQEENLRQVTAMFETMFHDGSNNP